MGSCMCLIGAQPNCGEFGRHDVDVNTAADWLARVDDGVSIADLSVPGTHETMCLYGGCWLQCQHLTLAQQLLAGVRFVDIRCRHYEDELPIHHAGVYQHATFDDVLADTLAFLAGHPREVVLMRVREEYLPVGNTGTFAQAVQAYVDRYPPELFWSSESIAPSKAPYPPLGEVRGRLIILRNYQGPATFGLPYEGMDIEDAWDVGTLRRKAVDRKWRLVRRHLEKAGSGSVGESSALYLTFSSGTGALAWPCALARRLNGRLKVFVSQRKRRRCGIVAMDFPHPGLVNTIIESNFEGPS